MYKRWFNYVLANKSWGALHLQRNFALVKHIKNMKGKTVMEVRLDVDEGYPKQFLDSAFEKLNLKEQHDWYNVTNQIIKTKIKGGDEFLCYFSNGLYEALEKAYPEMDWLPWKFPRVPKVHPSTYRPLTLQNFWEKEANQKRFFEYAAKELKIKTFEDWQVESSSNYIKYSEKMVTSILPQYNWEPWRFLRVSEGYWKEPKNQRAFLESLALKRNHRDFTDWYSIKRTEILEHGGRGLLSQYNNSHIQAITSVYSEFSWKIYRFHNLPDGYWNSLSNQRQLLDDLAKQLNLSTWEDWYHVKYEDIVQICGASFFVSNGDNFIDTIMKVYKEHDWKRWKFNSVKPGFWSKTNNQLEFMEDLGKKLNFQSMEDWYKLSTSHVVEHGGASLLSDKYFGSLFNLVKSIFPKYEWIPWKFSHVKPGFWDNKENVKAAVRWAEGQLNMKSIEDWQMVTVQLFQKLELTTLLQKYGGITKLLQSIYPKHDWENMRGSIAMEVSKFLKWRIEELFGGENVVLNFVHPTIKFPDSEESIKFDFYVPSQKIAFDIQAECRFEAVNFLPNKQDDLREQEWVKTHICKTNGLTLIQVPYWWDLTKESLVATINELRPELFPGSSGTPIPKDRIRK